MARFHRQPCIHPKRVSIIEPPATSRGGSEINHAQLVSSLPDGTGKTSGAETGCNQRLLDRGRGLGKEGAVLQVGFDAETVGPFGG
jgi:hypothetical protein